MSRYDVDLDTFPTKLVVGVGGWRSSRELDAILGRAENPGNNPGLGFDGNNDVLSQSVSLATDCLELACVDSRSADVAYWVFGLFEPP